MFYFDPYFLLCVMLPGMLISGAASMYVRSAYSTWSKRRNSSNLSGAETAQLIMRNYGLGVQLTETPGELSDHFDPGQQVVRLSSGVARQPSIAAMAIAAHEFGHVQQYQQKSPLIAARQFLVPAVNIGTNLAWIFIMAGLVLQFFELGIVGLLLFGLGALFALLTLPVELDASRRAMVMLEGVGAIRTQEDRTGVQRVLTAAALTYVAALLVAVLQLAYYAMLVFGMRRRD